MERGFGAELITSKRSESPVKFIMERSERAGVGLRSSFSSHKLAGMLEKQSRWRKEWSERFFVMDEDCIKYFVSPPAFLEDTAEESRGKIHLAGLVAEIAQDVGRPYCIRVGRDLLSCKSEPEQRKWLQAINGAAGALDGPSAASESAQTRPRCTDDEEPNLVLLRNDGPSQAVHWRQPTTVQLATPSTCILLWMDESRLGGGQALCRLALHQCHVGTSASFPAESLGGSHEPAVKSLSVKVIGADSLGKYAAFVPLILGIISVLSSMIWLWRLETSGLAVALLWHAWHWTQATPVRQITFMVEDLVKADQPHSAPEQNEAEGPVPAPREEQPNWCGTWTLDKSCSEKYENILKDMGVNYVIRKAADAKTSVLVISKSISHVTFIVKNLVTVEDVLPVDGAWVRKPVPPAGRMKGEMRLRLSKCTQNELEMVTEFPPGEGSLCDTLVVNNDRSSFSRRVVRTRSDGTELECTRVFRRT